MYRPNGQTNFTPNGPYQQSQSYQTPRPFQQGQQFGPRFQSPPQQFTPPSSFYQTSQQHHDHSMSAYQVPDTAIPPPFYQPPPQNQLPIQHIETPPNPKYPPPSAGPCFNQLSVSPYRTPGQIYVPLNQNYSQPPPVQNYNNCPPIQNFNHPPPIQNFNHPITPPFQSVNQSCNQPMGSPYQSPSPGFSATPNNIYQPQVLSPESLKRPYKLPADQCYQQQQSSFNLPRHEFNQRPSFRPSGQQRFPFNKQNPRYQQSQHGNRFQFQPKQQYQNYRPRGGPPPGFNNQSKENFIPKKDKNQVACELGDCDFVGHASAVKEHQNLHHRLGLHKKVLYSNNSDAVQNWIEERKKKWPTKENIQIKVDVEDEKNKRGERIADEDFQRFNKNNKSNNSGNKRFNNRKRPRFNGEFIQPVEEPMNGNLKRFAGIVDIIKDEQLEETNKPVALKLIQEYDQSSDNQSDNEPPEEMPINKKSGSPDNKNVSEQSENPCTTPIIEVLITDKNEEPSSTSVINNEVDSTTLIDNDSKAVSTDVNIDICSKINDKHVKTANDRGQKRKNTSKKESKPFKKMPPMRTPRTEVVERKGALLEALMGDLMRSERNTITQCICYIRNNMNRFCKIQVA
ncbi:nuclear fragile X mental retardation-interacting protein 1 [Acyrthosiphon pisum]|uniref:FMR1-interacting protein 1 conserved domain-containing protein n=1 Tax=Acyrthosiphon pisum TaxID=7029 RepID=A0A8R2B684_ACYPI|nr:nuclear fragile X mental retardation-interacting protein 1 [Acyrthosiphon pisum]XP_008183507.1 nuclear fragile X mental retardation-interacting protein 1 [Acyrthosiphon pisum]|eukprot:XP_001946648.1 PREDICTED: nuclear fragile X mental retardation-interacting protein 1 [Acyrthosiphon pisum]